MYVVEYSLQISHLNLAVLVGIQNYIVWENSYTRDGDARGFKQVFNSFLIIFMSSMYFLLVFPHLTSLFQYDCMIELHS